MSVKNALLLIGGVCAAAAGWIVLGSRRVSQVEDLAHQLEGAWADHHTQV